VLHLLCIATGLDRALTTTETRVLADTASGFWEVLARSYVFEVERLLRTDPIREYERRIDDLPFVRGSLVLAPTARAFYSGKLRFRSRFSRLSVDTPLNRVVRSALIRVASNPMSSAVVRVAAARLRAWLGDVGEIRPGDRTVELDRRTWHYRAARELADHVLDGSVQGWDRAGNAAMAFLIRTPLLVQGAIATILNRHLDTDMTVRARKLFLHGPLGHTVNPDLVFEPGPSALADVKYREAPSQWDRGDVYEVVSFGRHAGCSRVAIIDFSSSGERRPSLGFGENATTSTWASHLAWPLDEENPIRSQERMIDEVRRWLASDRGRH